MSVSVKANEAVAVGTASEGNTIGFARDVFADADTGLIEFNGGYE